MNETAIASDTILSRLLHVSVRLDFLHTYCIKPLGIALK